VTRQLSIKKAVSFRQENQVHEIERIADIESKHDAKIDSSREDDRSDKVADEKKQTVESATKTPVPTRTVTQDRSYSRLMRL